jgi:hypothetical protein
LKKHEIYKRGASIDVLWSKPWLINILKAMDY